MTMLYKNLKPDCLHETQQCWKPKNESLHKNIRAKFIHDSMKLDNVEILKPPLRRKKKVVICYIIANWILHA